MMNWNHLCVVGHGQCVEIRINFDISKHFSYSYTGGEELMVEPQYRIDKKYYTGFTMRWMLIILVCSTGIRT